MLTCHLHGHIKMKKFWETAKKWGSWAWKVVVIVGVILGIWTGYDQIFKTTSIFSQIISEVNVLDINEPLKDLQIIFQGKNIQEEKLNLKIYRVKVENNGGTNITQNDFDQSGSWGIKVNGGTAIETRLVDSNSDYIKKDLSPSVQDNNFVRFNKVIFDKGEFFTVELLVLHNKDAPPILYRTGKIAGIQDSEIKILAPEHSEPFLKTLFYGSWWIQLIRAALYFIASIAIFIGVLVLFMKWDERRKRAAQSPQPPQQPS